MFAKQGVCCELYLCAVVPAVQVMNYSVLRNRPELRFSMETVLLFPFYRTWCLLFRLYALLRNVIQYSAWVRKFIRISTREQDMHDIPPVRAVRVS